MMTRMTLMTATAAMMIKSLKEVTLRHEFKHQISPGEDLVLSQRLRKLFLHDKYAGPGGSYRITSLYFDTPYDSAYKEKLDGVDNREKFRLRYYGTDTSFIRLEKKFKRKGLCGKRSASLIQDQAEKILRGDYEFLLKSADPLLIELYSKIRGKGLRPKTIVCYDREAFVYAPGNVRITLDRNLYTGLGSIDFLNTEIKGIKAMDASRVLEVKYDEFLPELVRMAVQVPGRQAGACSKYALCRRFD